MDKPKDMPRSKKKYYILRRGRQVGTSWAVSPQKAITNWWWKNVKGGDEFSYREYNPSDFDAVEAGR